MGMACLSVCHVSKKLISSRTSLLQAFDSASFTHYIPNAKSSICRFFCSALHRTQTVASSATHRYGASRSLLSDFRQTAKCHRLVKSQMNAAVTCSPKEVKASDLLWHPGTRSVHVSAGPVLAAGQFGVRGDADRKQDKDSHDGRKNQTSDSAWAVRLANENGYLSWCRNTYLTTVVAIAMLGQGTTAMAQHAAEGAFFVAGMNLTWGTTHFIYNLLYLRRQVGMSVLGALLQVSMATFHLVLWFMLCVLYISYSDECDVEDMKGQLEEEAEKGKI